MDKHSPGDAIPRAQLPPKKNNDNDDNNNNWLYTSNNTFQWIIIIHFIFFIYVLTQQPKGNYKISTSKIKEKTHKQKTKQGNLYHLGHNKIQ
jgi:hypothetical protein